MWFLVLLGALLLAWQHRFERLSAVPSLRLSDLRSSAALPPGVRWVETHGSSRLILEAKPVPGETVIRFDLPFTKPTDFLHLKVQLSANGLIPGNKWWQDGRGIIEWHPGENTMEFENDGFGSVRYDQPGRISEFVMRPDCPPAIPAMRLENLGVSGELQLSVFEASVVRERWIWKMGRWVLLAGWSAWFFAWIRFSGNRRTFRGLLASMVWLLTGIYFVIPGPWKIQRSVGPAFELGGPAKFSLSAEELVHSDSTATGRAVPPSPDPLKSIGEIPAKGDFSLRLKHYAEHLRPLLHGLLLFGPTMLTACLVGRRPALSLAIILALAIEAAQYAFGYGFDLKDLVDLACDATGIVVALAVHACFKRLLPTMDLG